MPSAICVSRKVPGSASEVMRAWTDPDELRAYWDPAGTSLVRGAVDRRVGGSFRYELASRDGRREIVIEGSFLVVHPVKLVYSWRRSAADGSADVPGSEIELRLVETPGPATIVSVVHRGLPEHLREGQRSDWRRTLIGLEAHMFGRVAPEGTAR